MSGTTTPTTAVPALLDATALNQGMIAPMNALVATDQTPTPVTYRFLNSVWSAGQQIWAQIVSFQSTLESMAADIITNTANIAAKTALHSMGVTDGSDAAPGEIGEFMSASSALAPISTGVATNLASINLTAGDWDVSGVAAFSATPGPVPATLFGVGIGSIDTYLMPVFPGTPITQHLNTALRRYSITATTTVWVLGQADFTTGTVTAGGFIRARRVR